MFLSATTQLRSWYDQEATSLVFKVSTFCFGLFPSRGFESLWATHAVTTSYILFSLTNQF